MQGRISLGDSSSRSNSTRRWVPVVTRDFIELSADAVCLCGSGRQYAQCCSLKLFKYGFDSAGNAIRRVPRVDGMENVFVDASDKFFELYGRRPGAADLVFGHLSDPTDSVYSSARLMLRAGLPEEYVYAYVRTDGLMPAEMNTDLISDEDLELFQTYVEEYRRVSSEPFSAEGVSSLAFVTHGNGFIRDSIAYSSTKLMMVVVDFVSRHLGSEDWSSRMGPSKYQTTAFRVRTPLDYCLFSAVKTKRTLESLERLSDVGVPQSVYALARSVFENTLFLDAIAEDESVFWQSISPKTDEENYTFGFHADGSVNYNHVVHRNTGVRAHVNLRVSDLAQSATTAPHVADLYSLFYVTACQFVHVDVLSAQSYFDDPDPFDQLDPDIIAGLVATVLIGDLIRALVSVKGVGIEFRKDAMHALSDLGTVLDNSLRLAASDPEHRNDVLDTLRKVTASWLID